MRALDAHTVVIVFPAPFGPGIAMLDSLPILPAHKLQAALDAGHVREAWGVTTPLARPRRPRSVRACGSTCRASGCVFARNPRYWRQDGPAQPLPYLDEIEVQIVPDTNGEVLRLQAGQVDLMTDYVRAEDIAALRSARNATARSTLMRRRASRSAPMRSGSTSARPRRPRRIVRGSSATSCAARSRTPSIARRSSTSVYLGAAEPVFGPITPGHGDWFVPDLPKTEFDRRARDALLDRRSGSSIATATALRRRRARATGAIHGPDAEGPRRCASDRSR